LPTYLIYSAPKKISHGSLNNLFFDLFIRHFVLYTVSRNFYRTAKCGFDTANLLKSDLVYIILTMQLALRGPKAGALDGITKD